MTILTKKGEVLLYEDESYKLRGLWMKIFNTLGPGHKEITYGNAFEQLLKQEEILYEREPTLVLSLDSKKVGTYRPNFIVYGKIIVEFKSLNFIPPVFAKKIYQYLKSSDYKLGFVVNFGAPELEIIRRVYDSKRHQSVSAQSACNPSSPRASACNPLYPRNKGFAALLAVIIIGAAALIIALNSSLLGLGELDLGYTSQKGDEAFSIADGCMEEALRRLRIAPTLAGTFTPTISNGSCTFTIVNPGPPINITATGCTAISCPSTSGYSKKIRVELTIDILNGQNAITINKWEELSS